MGVVIKTYANNKSQNAKFYLHEIIEIKEADLYKQTAPQLSVDAEHKSTSNNTIPQSAEKNNTKKSLDVEDYKISDNKAVMTQQRLDDEIKNSGAGSRTDYANSWITAISPSDFLNITSQEWHI